MPDLCVNVDHVATVRQARRTFEPDPVWAAALAELAGAAGITVHLREDRRHVQDRDVERLRDSVQVRLNLEMAATDEMLAIAERIRPDVVMLVPEGRHEVTTEGGLDVVAERAALADAVARLADAGLPASAFVNADPAQIEAAATCGFAVCEVHTGPWAHAVRDAGRDPRCAAPQAELARIRDAGRRITEAGMRFNAGHALDLRNVGPVAALPDLCELHIGHSIVSRAVLVGMTRAVREMRETIERAAAGG